jgi:glycosyltransferase involved in cell wall biosynthesis
MSTPRVTALIDTFNHGRFIEQAVESVLAQDFSHEEMEILVVDDGSTDDTAARMEKYAGRVRYLRKENGGQASALNVGIREARGEIVALLDADDYWLPHKLGRVVEEFDRRPDTGMVYHPFLFWREPAAPAPAGDFPTVTGDATSSLANLLLYRGQATSGIAFRKSVVERLLPIPDSLRILADGYLIYLVIFIAPVAAITEPLTVYRLHEGNLFHCSPEQKDRLRQKLACQRTLLKEMQVWLEREKFWREQSPAATFLQRMELHTRWMEFTIEGTRRGELYRYLREERGLYAPLWTARYRAFRALLGWAALLLGFPAFTALQAAYQDSAWLRKVRRTLLRQSSQPLPVEWFEWSKSPFRGT